jgi:RecA-family ATPase
VFKDISGFATEGGGLDADTIRRNIYSEDDRPRTRQLMGRSFVEYAKMDVPSEETLLGNQWLCRGGGALIVAPSGQGKSVLTAQVSILWGCNKAAFGIKPSRPLRSLILQAEDDDRDMKEMGEILNHLHLNDSEIRMVDTNTFVEPCNDLCSGRFLESVDSFLEQRPSDLLWINPFSAYLGADVKNSEANNLFLRTGLHPILKTHDCAVILIDHTPKTNFNGTENYKPSDWMYRGSGRADITNWARAIMVIDPCANMGTFKFIAAKRGSASVGVMSIR